ncbi:uncharacterized protein ACNLHF_022306 isoform 1-T1 [Anomaloglossus baeobatrachus]
MCDDFMDFDLDPLLLSAMECDASNMTVAGARTGANSSAATSNINLLQAIADHKLMWKKSLFSKENTPTSPRKASIPTTAAAAAATNMVTSTITSPPHSSTHAVQKKTASAVLQPLAEHDANSTTVRVEVHATNSSV